MKGTMTSSSVFLGSVTLWSPTSWSKAHMVGNWGLILTTLWVSHPHWVSHLGSGPRCQVFLWLQFSPMSWLQLHVRFWIRSTQLRCSQISDSPQSCLWDHKHVICSLMLPSFWVTDYTASNELGGKQHDFVAGCWKPREQSISRRGCGGSHPAQFIFPIWWVLRTGLWS